MVSQEEYQKAVVSRDLADKTILAFNQQKQKDFQSRWERFDKQGEFFKDEDLVYAATSRCEKCKAGLAYPKECGPLHQWTCSNVLKGVGTDKEHSAFPFAFYEIKSENQPSAMGATTRP